MGWMEWMKVAQRDKWMVVLKGQQMVVTKAVQKDTWTVVLKGQQMGDY